MRRPGLPRLRIVARILMVVAALFFAAQGAFAFRAQAAETLAKGPALWHAHFEEDGSRHVHAHAVDADGGGHLDLHGKLKCGSAAVSAAAVPNFSVVTLQEVTLAAFSRLVASLPRGLDPGGLRRPPRTPNIA